MYELNSSSSRKTRPPLGCWSFVGLVLDPNNDAASPDEDLFTPSSFATSAAFRAGLAVLLECIVLDIEGASRVVVCFAADRAHCRHIVLSAACAAEFNGRCMVSGRSCPRAFPSSRPSVNCFGAHGRRRRLLVGCFPKVEVSSFSTATCAPPHGKGARATPRAAEWAFVAAVFSSPPQAPVNISPTHCQRSSASRFASDDPTHTIADRSLFSRLLRALHR